MPLTARPFRRQVTMTVLARSRRLIQRLGPYQSLVIMAVPVALVYNSVSHVVMLATPQDLHDFALGFSLNNSSARFSDIKGSRKIALGNICDESAS